MVRIRRRLTDYRSDPRVTGLAHLDELAAGAGCSIVAEMSTVVEIEAAIEKLSIEEQREVADWLNSRLIEETPEMLAALDEGIRSLATEPRVPIEDVRRKIAAWTTR